MIQKQFYWILLLLLVIGSGCNRKAAIAKSDEMEEVEQVVEVIDDSAEEEEIVEINTEDQDDEEPIYILCELKRTSCYGKCPSYSIKLYSDGNSIYQGKANVERIGKYKAFVSSQDFESIFEAAAQANYFVLKSQYPPDGRTIPDLPKTITYLKRNGLEKQIIDNYDAPPALQDFEKWLDSFFDSLDWKKVD